MANWLAALAGLGKASGGLPEGLIQREKFDLEGDRTALADRRAAEQSRQFAESQARQASQFQQQEDRLNRAETATDDLSAYGGPANVPRRLASPLLASILGTRETQRKEADATGKRESLATGIEAAGGATPPVYGEEEGGAYMPGAPADPKFATAARFARAGAGVDSLFKHLYPDPRSAAARPQIVGENARGIVTPGGELQEFPPRPAPPTFTPPAGYVPSHRVDAKGGVSTEWKPPGEEKGPRTVIERYAAEQGISLGEAEQQLSAARARGAAGSRPMEASDKQVMNALSTTLASIREFQEFTPEEIKKYTGMAQSAGQAGLSALRGLPVVGAGFGTPDERFEKYRSLMGRFQAGMFQEGGKQLTGIEKRVAEQYTPTGRETGGAGQIASKLKNLEAFTRLGLRVRSELAKTGRADIDPLELEQIMEAELTKAGLIRGGGGTPPQAAPAPRGTQGETLSRRDPLYQKARQKGLTDEQIRQKYGVTVTD